MKITVLDHPRENPGEICWSELYTLGEVSFYDSTRPEQVVERVGDAEIVLLNKTVFSGDAMRRCPNLKMISAIATGYNTIDMATANELGIIVSNVPSYGTLAIAQHAFALLLEITNHVAHHDTEVRKGRKNSERDWCFWDYPPIELENKTMGILGLGRIGFAMMQMARGFGMKVIACDPYPSDAAIAAGCRYVSEDELYAQADVLSLHCPLLPGQEHKINRDTIAKMKDGVIFLNNSRGALVDEAALAEGLKSGKIYAAGLDAVEYEPIAMDNPLLDAPNCFITPHISWAARECRQRLVDTTLENVRNYLRGAPSNVVH